jgi:hypothetical protein
MQLAYSRDPSSSTIKFVKPFKVDEPAYGRLYFEIGSFLSVE